MRTELMKDVKEFIKFNDLIHKDYDEVINEFSDENLTDDEMEEIENLLFENEDEMEEKELQEKALEVSTLKGDLERQKSESQLAIQTAQEIHRQEIQAKDEQIEFYKDFKGGRRGPSGSYPFDALDSVSVRDRSAGHPGAAVA